MNPSDTHQLERTLQAKVGAQVRLLPEGVDRFRVFTPFVFDDGDHFSIVLRKSDDGWEFADEGHTFMRLTYDVDETDFRQGSRQQVISSALKLHSVEDRDGSLVLPVVGDSFGDSLFTFVQAITRISDVTLLTKERVRSTFLEDFRKTFKKLVPATRMTLEWHDEHLDPKGHYAVDCRINGTDRPLLVFALNSDGRVQAATVKLYWYLNKKVPHRSLGVFEDQEDIGRDVLARFSDVAGKQFSTLPENETGIVQYLQAEGLLPPPPVD